MIDPTRAAVPTHPQCAASPLLGRRHRVGAYPYVVVNGDARRALCSTRCLFAWRARNRRLWAASRLDPGKAAS